MDKITEIEVLDYWPFNSGYHTQVTFNNGSSVCSCGCQYYNLPNLREEE